MNCNHTYSQKLDTLNPSLKEKLCSLCLNTELEQLKAENEGLAAHQCKYPAGDEFGNAYCTEINNLREALEPMRKLLVSLKENGSSHAFFIMQQAWGNLDWDGVVEITDSLLGVLKDSK